MNDIAKILGTAFALAIGMFSLAYLMLLYLEIWMGQ